MEAGGRGGNNKYPGIFSIFILPINIFQNMFYHYPAFIRIWHFLNVVFVLLLLLSGVILEFSDDPVGLAWLRMHKVCGGGLTLNYLVFLVGNMVSGNGKHYRSGGKGSGRKMIRQLQYYTWGHRREMVNPNPVTEERKFNPLQALTYLVVMYAGVPILCITGVGLIFPAVIPGELPGQSGVWLINTIHVVTGFLLGIFMLLHIYVLTIGKNPGDNFRPILTGWSVVEKRNNP